MNNPIENTKIDETVDLFLKSFEDDLIDDEESGYNDDDTDVSDESSITSNISEDTNENYDDIFSDF